MKQRAHALFIGCVVAMGGFSAPLQAQVHDRGEESASGDTASSGGSAAESVASLLAKFIQALLGGGGSGAGDGASSFEGEKNPERDLWPMTYNWEGSSSSPGINRMMASAQTAIQKNIQEGGMGVSDTPRAPSEVNQSLGLCYRHVKFILKDSGCVQKNQLTGGQAKIAGPELQAAGFRQIYPASPYEAPTGAVIVYQCGEHGHIEWKGPNGFYSDYMSPRSLQCSNFQVYYKEGCLAI